MKDALYTLPIPASIKSSPVIPNHLLRACASDMSHAYPRAYKKKQSKSGTKA